MNRFRLATALHRLLHGATCRFCGGPLDAADIVCIAMCDRCCRHALDVVAAHDGLRAARHAARALRGAGR